MYCRLCKSLWNKSGSVWTMVEPHSSDNKDIAQPGPPMWLLAELTYRCPLHCAFCYNPIGFDKVTEELDTEGWLKTLRQARELGSVQVGFSGGEPLMRPDLEELVTEARQLGYYTNLLTSGVGLKKARAKALKESGLDHIQLSFQDSTRELNDFLSNTRTFELKREVAAMIKDNGWRHSNSVQKHWNSPIPSTTHGPGSTVTSCCHRTIRLKKLKKL